MNDEKEKREYEERLQHRLKLLRDKLEAGEVHFLEGLQVSESLKAVRLAPDGSVDLATVDSSVRSLALGIGVMHEREETKKNISLSDVQNIYFNALQINFGSFYEMMKGHNLTPHQVARFFSEKNETVQELNRMLPEFIGWISEFWSNTADAVQYHTEDIRETFRGVFGGDLFPSNSQSIASKCCVYIDTLVLPCPFMRTKHVFDFYPPAEKAYYLLKHALNVLQYKDLACADVNPPIVVILPGAYDIDSDEKEYFSSMAASDYLPFAERIFGRKFESDTELMEFTVPLDNPEKIISAVVDPTQVVFQIGEGNSLKEQLEYALTTEDAKLLTQHFSLGQYMVQMGMGRLGVCNELLYKSRQLGGVPIIDAPTSWQYFVWKLENDASIAERETNIRNLHVVKGLQELSENKMEWLGMVPHEAIIELRREGAIHEIRDILGKGVSDLTTSTPMNFQGTTDRVFENIQNAFVEHRKKVYELQQKGWQFGGTTIASWFAVGTIAAATAAISDIPQVAAATILADKIIDPPTRREIQDKRKELSLEKEAIKKSPVGILFRYADEI